MPIYSTNWHAYQKKDKISYFFVFSLFDFTAAISLSLQRCEFCKKKRELTLFSIGSDSCGKKYHVDCGVENGAFFDVGDGQGTVSLCYEHRDPIER